MDNVKVLNCDNVVAYKTEGDTAVVEAAVVEAAARVNGHQVVYKVVVSA